MSDPIVNIPATQCKGCDVVCPLVTPEFLGFYGEASNTVLATARASAAAARDADTSGEWFPFFPGATTFQSTTPGPPSTTYFVSTSKAHTRFRVTGFENNLATFARVFWEITESIGFGAPVLVSSGYTDCVFNSGEVDEVFDGPNVDAPAWPTSDGGNSRDFLITDIQCV